MHIHTAGTKGSITAAAARKLLEEGNERFQQAKMANRDLPKEVSETSDGQFPFAAIVGCIDSRVSPELVFDQGIGDIFSVRIAGNIVSGDAMGSLEFSCKVAGARLIVVLGHEGCGAVKGACDGVELGSLTQLLASIQPAVEATTDPSDAAQRNSSNAEFVQAVAHNNVRRTVSMLRESPVLGEMQSAGEVEILGAMYDVATGKVEFME